MTTQYTSKERLALWCLAAFSFLSVNLAFIYVTIFEPENLIQALKNPISFAFILEAFLLMGTLSYLLARWRVSTLRWYWFIILSILGSMGFALPVVLLWPNRKEESKL